MLTLCCCKGDHLLSQTANTSEAAVLVSLVAWSQECPNWQRDALRRLCTTSILDNDDTGALLAICKGEAIASPLTGDHVRAASASQSVVTLKQLHGTQHVNALAAGERLTFARSGLTVVYGDNGSGKSGYARILKKMCRARVAGKGEAILPNIYDANPGTPTASIDFVMNSQNSSANWSLDQASDPALSAVNVFDSRTASVHVSQVNDVAYTPFPLKILAQLAQACQSLKERLTAEIKAIDAQTPQAIKQPSCKPHTEVGGLFVRMAKATPEQVQALATLSQEETDRLGQLNRDLASDPIKAGRQLTTLKVKVEGIAARIVALADTVAPIRADELHAAADDYATAREAAQAASTALFVDEPLPNIGSETWRALWDAARRYSEAEAYPDRPFPVTQPPSVCVLCQQDIAPEAGVRLNRFEAFIRDDSKRRESEAKDIYDSALASLRGAKISRADVRAMVRCAVDELSDDALGQDLRRSVVANLWRLRQMERRHGRQVRPIYRDPVAPPAERLSAHATDLSNRAAGLTAEADTPERKALINERDGLADRQWLGTILDDVLAEIERIKKIAALKKAEQETRTNRITGKSTEVAEALVTNALRAQFAIEVGRIGVTGLAIELKQEKSAYGIPRFKVALTRNPAAGVGDVLSEGEHRCVALAAFLAELATSDSKSAIVFDDPVSSLDHMHREAVANRLIEESVDRQVIVFTHDIAFLFLLDEACREADPKPQMAIRSISRGRDAAGFCNTDPPFKARPLADVIGAMQSRLDNERIHHDRGNHAQWEVTVRSLQEQLRTCWERAVEDTVAPVLRRLSHKVTTPGLVRMTAITRQDCEDMRDAYGRCSALLHSEARELNAPLASVEAVQAEITALGAWVVAVTQRQKAVAPV